MMRIGVARFREHPARAAITNLLARRIAAPAPREPPLHGRPRSMCAPGSRDLDPRRGRLRWTPGAAKRMSRRARRRPSPHPSQASRKPPPPSTERGRRGAVGPSGRAEARSSGSSSIRVRSALRSPWSFGGAQRGARRPRKCSRPGIRNGRARARRGRIRGLVDRGPARRRRTIASHAAPGLRPARTRSAAQGRAATSRARRWTGAPRSPNRRHVVRSRRESGVGAGAQPRAPGRQRTSSRPSRAAAARPMTKSQSLNRFKYWIASGRCGSSRWSVTRRRSARRQTVRPW